jgi:uncharacterized protein
MKKVIIAGGSGFIGKKLSQHYIAKGCEVVVLTRKKPHEESGIRFAQWDAKTLGPWSNELEGASLLINMVGRSVDCRYNRENKKQIYESRIDSTRILGKAVNNVLNPPLLWLNSSSATIYRHAEDRQMDEATGDIGTGFSVDVCKKWEEAFFDCETTKTRKVALRSSIVLGKNGGALKPLINLSKLGFGGYQGNGKQYFSWVHEDDLIAAIDFVFSHQEIQGVINIASPYPQTNKELMHLLRKILKVPFGIPMPKFLLEFGAFIINTETELILKSRNVIPGVLLDNGFVFKYPRLEQALEDLI